MKRKGPSRELLGWYIALKARQTCSRCGGQWPNHVEVIDFDHQPGTTKRWEISRMVRLGMPKELILKELAKTRPLCANCHRIVTKERRKKK